MKTTANLAQVICSQLGKNNLFLRLASLTYKKWDVLLDQIDVDLFDKTAKSVFLYLCWSMLNLWFISRNPRVGAGPLEMLHMAR